MKKHALLTLCVGDLYRLIGGISHSLMRDYAGRIDADFIVISDFGEHTVGPYAKLDAMFRLLKEYERVCFVDTDILIRADTPSIFDLVPNDRLGLFDEGAVLDRSQAWSEVFTVLGYPVNPMQSFASPVYYNTGVIVASKEHQSLFAPFASEVDCYAEQSAFNVRVWDRKVKVFNLPYRYNRINPISSLTGECWDDSFFAHFAGCFSLENTSLKSNFEEFKAMSERFSSYKPGCVPRFHQRIRIDYQGALGDLIAGEPLIRFLVEKLYPQESILIRCNYPEVLAHLERTVINFTDYYEKVDYEYVITPIPEDVQDPIFHITHPLDFMSLKVFKGMLPSAYRNIKLKPAEQIPWDLSMHALVHFGNTWTSKAFPVEFCNAIIHGLLAKKIPVALIGSQTVDGLDWEGTLDLRGKTTLPQLFKVISEGALLISNDSSPVHIAGAFGNPCILIPSCKEPDHVWPYREPRLNIALGKTFPLDLRPNKPRVVQRVDEATCDQLWEILPEANEVVQAAVKAWLSAGLLEGKDRSYNLHQEDISS